MKSINSPVIFLRKSFPSWRRKNSNRSASALTSLGWMILHWDPQMAPRSCDSPLHLSMSAIQTLSAVKALVTVHRLTFFQHVPLRKITSHSLIPQSMCPSKYKFSYDTKTIQLLEWAKDTHEDCRVSKPFLLFCGRGKHRGCCLRHYEPEKFSVSF